MEKKNRNKLKKEWQIPEMKIIPIKSTKGGPGLMPPYEDATYRSS